MCTITKAVHYFVYKQLPYEFVLVGVIRKFNFSLRLLTAKSSDDTLAMAVGFLISCTICSYFTLRACKIAGSVI